MPEQYEMKEVVRWLKEISEKLAVAKKKDNWDKLPIITTFLGTFVVGVLTLILTQSYQRLVSNQQEKFQTAQIAAQRAQIRIEELKAITSVAPLLASKDPETREVGKKLLRAVSESNLPDFAPDSGHPTAEHTVKTSTNAPTKKPVADSSPKTTPFSVIDRFAQIALASREPTYRRVAATKEIGKIASESAILPAVRQRAVNTVTTIALSASAPEEVRRTASEIIATIRSVVPEKFAALIEKMPVTRKINEIILHHTAEPSISTYKGPEDIFSMAESQMKIRKWSKISWHYAVSPDGMIWLGMPVNEETSHAVQRNQDSVSVLLVIDGDREMPTEPQKRALGILLRDLLNKFQLSAEANFSEKRGFHRYYYRKTCPGKNISPKLVLDCIKAARQS